jgi:hypothetical protein
MGIARRKAGTVVRCPRCAGQVIVPDPGPEVTDAAADAPPPPEGSNGPGPEPPRPVPLVPPLVPPPAPPPGTSPGPVLFEQSDFEKLFEPGPLVPAAPVLGTPPPQMPSVPPPPLPQAGYDVEPLPAFTGTAGPAGLFLTPAKLTLLSVAVVILLGLAFFLGMLVGRA